MAPPRTPRSLLRQIVEAMAGKAPAQAKLNVVATTSEYAAGRRGMYGRTPPAPE